MEWVVISPLVAGAAEPIRVATALDNGSRVGRLRWVAPPARGRDWNATVLAAWMAGADYALLLQPRVTLSDGALAALVAFAPSAPYIGFMARHVVVPDGRCWYVPQTPERVGEPIDAVRVLSRTALDCVAGAPMAGNHRPMGLWMTKRLGRYGIRPRLIPEAPDQVVIEEVETARGLSTAQPTARDRLLR